MNEFDEFDNQRGQRRVCLLSAEQRRRNWHIATLIFRGAAFINVRITERQ